MLAMIALARALDTSGLRAPLLLQVHDEVKHRGGVEPVRCAPCEPILRGPAQGHSPAQLSGGCQSRHNRQNT
jgi:hypothetical protein